MHQFFFQNDIKIIAVAFCSISLTYHRCQEKTTIFVQIESKVKIHNVTCSCSEGFSGK